MKPDTQMRRSPWLRRYAASVLALLVVLIATAGFFFLSRSVEADQGQRLLADRAKEVQALLANSFASIDSSLRILGPIGASPGASAAASFRTAAEPLLKSGAETIGVAAKDGDGFTVRASVGDGPAVGAALSADRAALAAEHWHWMSRSWSRH